MAHLFVQSKCDRALGPLVQQIEEEFERKLKELKARKGLSARAKTIELAEKYDPAMRVLALKVLDPAMGSGHFLVAAVDFLADRINDLLEKHNGEKHFGNEPYESPLYHQIEEVRRKIRESAAQQGVELDESKLEDKHIIKRMVMKRCIYGVDLNEMAVELAKVSLWLHSFTVGAPLSFLDHHLKCGNSLIGVLDVSDVIVESSPRYREFVQALHNMILVGQLTDVTLADTHESARLFAEFKELLKPFRRRLDISLAIEHFMDLKKNQKIAVLSAMEQKDGVPPETTAQQAQALEIARQKRFFHWELEFPEVWYTERGPRENPGFDAVVGNPPYGSKGMLSTEDKNYIFEHFEYTNSADTAALFTEQSFKLLATDGCWGFIVPKPLSYITSWSDIRAFLLSQRLSHIGDVSKAFEEVLLEQIVLIAAKASPKDTVNIAVVAGTELSDIEEVRLSESTSRLFPVYRFGRARQLAQRIEAASGDLSQYVRIWAGIGGITGTLSRDATGPQILKGQSLARYCETDDTWYVPKQVPSKTDYQQHNHKRIVAQDIVAHVIYPKDHIILMATLAEPGIITHETVINFTNKIGEVSDHFLLSLLNSRLISWYVYYFIFNRAIRTMHYRPGYADFTPIRRIFFTTPAPERQKLVEELKKLYPKELTK